MSMTSYMSDASKLLQQAYRLLNEQKSPAVMTQEIQLSEDIEKFFSEHGHSHLPTDEIGLAMHQERDQYLAIAVSVSAITQAEADFLEGHASQGGCVMSRNNGWFVKIADDDLFDYIPKEFSGLANILQSAHDAGFRMVEFDCDATLTFNGDDDE